MRLFNSSIIRAIVAIVAGVLMIMYDELMIEWLTRIIGGLFILSGVISLCMYYIQRKRVIKNLEEEMILPEKTGIENDKAHKEPTPRTLYPFPIVGFGSVLFGVVLVFLTGTFLVYVPRIIAGILILLALNQFINLGMMIRVRALNWKFWVLPAVIFLVACIMAYDPKAFVATPLLMLGIFMVIYGITELVNMWKISKVRRLIENEKTSVESIETVDAIEIID